jgi:Spy/CpxP family protein refolding chaperone
MNKQTLRIVALCAGLSVSSFAGWSFAADEPAKPAAPAADQPAPPTTRRARPSAADMIKNYRDQFEGLGLSDDQMTKIDGFITTAETEIKGLAGKEDQESGRSAFGAMRKLGEDVQSVLTDAQKTALRKKQQADRFDRFKKIYTAPELKLTDDQTTKINAIMADYQKESAAIDFTDPESRRKGFEARRAVREKLNAVLTPEQQKLIPQFGGPGGRGGARTRGTATPPPA